LVSIKDELFEEIVTSPGGHFCWVKSTNVDSFLWNDYKNTIDSSLEGCDEEDFYKKVE